MPGAKITGPSIPDIMGRLGGAIKKGQTETLYKASAKAKTIHQQHMRAAIGGDMRMSNVGKRGARISIKYRVGKKGELPWASIKVTGPAQLIERDTRAHPIYPRGTSGGRQGAGRKKKFNATVGPFAMQGPIAVGKKRGNLIMPPVSGFRRSAFHPGTTGKHPFARGQKAAQPAVLRIIRGNMFRVIKAAAVP
jgi:hypothetical protein